MFVQLISFFLFAALAIPAYSNAWGQDNSANELAREVIQHEVLAQDEDHSHWRYQQETEKDGKKEVKEVVETKDGSIERLVSVNGKPLTPDQQKKEDDRIQKLISNPDDLRKQREAKRQDSQKTKQLFEMFPKAFLFTEAGQNGDVATLNFKPNPNFRPPNREARVFHEMVGQLIVNTREKRLIEIKGHLLNEVKFGGGLFGHLDPGGTFDVKQVEVAPNHWEMTSMNINMKGKALLFKTLSVQEREEHSEFHPVTDTITLAQAKDLLKKEPTNRD